MAILKKYNSTQKKKTLEGTIPSGWESGDSKAEMLIIEPLIQHPEIPGLYRAVDPTTGWKGWVEYTPPVVQPPIEIPNPIVQKIADYRKKLSLLKEKKQLVDLGVLTKEEAGIDILVGEIKVLYEQVKNEPNFTWQ